MYTPVPPPSIQSMASLWITKWHNGQHQPHQVQHFRQSLRLSFVKTKTDVSKNCLSDIPQFPFQKVSWELKQNVHYDWWLRFRLMGNQKSLWKGISHMQRKSIKWTAKSWSKMSTRLFQTASPPPLSSLIYSHPFLYYLPLLHLNSSVRALCASL